MPNFGTKLFNTFNVYSFLCTKIGTTGGIRTHMPEDAGLSDQCVYRSTTVVLILGARPRATHPRFSRGLSLVRLLRETW